MLQKLAAATHDKENGKATRRRWAPRIFAAAAIALAGFLLTRTLGRYSADDILASLRAIAPTRIALALVFAAASYACLTGFDWLALRAARQHLPYRTVALASFCSLSLGHNIGFAAL